MVSCALFSMTAGQMCPSPVPKHWPRCCARAVTPLPQSCLWALQHGTALAHSLASSKEVACVWSPLGVGVGMVASAYGQPSKQGVCLGAVT